MKRKFLTLSLALLMSLLLTISASAAEYGVVYTEADTLHSEELTQLGRSDLPLFTETYGIDLRVDVLTILSDFSSLEEAAPVIYDTYEYGCGEGRNGMTLSVLVHEDEDGVVMDEWYVYAAGDSNELVTNGVWSVFPALGELMTDENWAGDAQQDTQTLVAAVRTMRDNLEGFVLAGGVADTIWSPMDSEPEVPAEAPADVPDRFPAPGGAIGYVTDTAGIMTAQERQSLEQTAQEISQTHGFGVYIITVDSFRDVTDSYDVFDGAATLYNKYDLGLSEDRRGVLLLLSMNGRDFSLITHGDYGEYVFDQDTREAMTDYFLDDFSYDAWYDGFADYLSVSNDVLTDGPDKLQSEINALTGMIFLVPLIPAAIGVFILGRKMKSVAAATQAEAYVSGVPELTVSEDRYTHTTEVRRKIKDEDSDQSSGGGVRSRSSGSFSGTSGKF